MFPDGCWIITLVPTSPMSNQGTPETAYEDDWRLYYAQRRAIMRRLGQYAFGAALVAGLHAAVNF